MAFPTIPTAGAGRVLTNTQADTTATRTFPNLSGLTKNPSDLLIAICVAYQTDAASPPGVAFSGWTAGWTEFVDQSTTTGMAIGAAYKWSTGTETGTIAVTQAATITGHAAMILLSIPGAHATTPPEGGTIANGTSAAADPPAGLNPAGWGTEDTLWVAVGASGEVSTTSTWTGIASAPANYTGYVDTGVSGDVAGAVEAAVAFRQLNAASEDVGAYSVDLTNARNSALLIAVPPAVPTTTSTGEVSLASAGEPATRTLHALTARARVQTAVGATLRLQLFEGATQRSTEKESGTLTTSLADVSLPISDAEAAAITSYGGDLRIRFRVYSAAGATPTGEISRLRLTAPAGGAPHVDDTASVTDTATKTVGRGTQADTASVTDAATKGTVRGIQADTATVTDNAGIRSPHPALADTASVTDTATKTVGRGTQADTATTTDTTVRSVTRGAIPDTATVTDTTGVRPQPAKADTATVADSLTATVESGAQADTATVTDATAARVIPAAIPDAATVTDTTTAAVSVVRADTADIADEVSTTSTGTATYQADDTVTVTDTAAVRVMPAAIPDAATVADGTTIALQAAQADTATVTDGSTVASHSAPADVATVGDSLAITVGAGKTDPASVTDASSRAAGVQQANTATIGDNAGVFALHSAQADTASITDSAVPVGTPASTTTSIGEVSLAPAGTPATRTEHVLTCRARVQTAVSATARLQLYEGSTARSTEKESGALTTGLADYSLPITDEEAAAITSYGGGDLRIRFRVYSDTAASATAEISRLRLQTPASGQPTIDDTVSVTDTAAKTVGRAAQQDTAGIVDAATATWDVIAPDGDDLTIGDSIAAAVTHPAGDSVTVTDSVETAGTGQHLQDVDDTATIGDSIATAPSGVRIDTAAVADSHAAAVTQTQADTAAVSDATARHPKVSVADTATVTDSVETAGTGLYTKSLSDTATVGDSVAAATVTVRQIADTATVGDSPHAAPGIAAADTATATDSTTAHPTSGQADTATVTDTAARVAAYLRTIGDTALLADTTSTQHLGPGPTTESHPPLGGIYDTTGTGGTHDTTGTGGTVTEPARTGIIVATIRGGIVVELNRNGRVTEPARNGAIDETLTGAEVY